jgi:hypothetical protein
VKATSYSERVYPTCGRRFTLVTTPEQILLTKQYEELTDISTDVDLINFSAGLKE